MQHLRPLAMLVMSLSCAALPALAETEPRTIGVLFAVHGGDARPYPPLRQTPVDQARPDTDPSLAFDIPAWGHLGYDPAKGPPDDKAPVQGQYRGTWVMWQPPNDDPRMGTLLARQVGQFLQR